MLPSQRSGPHLDPARPKEAPSHYRRATVARAQAADEARGLAIDSIAKAASGHMGLPLGCADLGAVLFGRSDELLELVRVRRAAALRSAAW